MSSVRPLEYGSNCCDLSFLFGPFFHLPWISLNGTNLCDRSAAEHVTWWTAVGLGDLRTGRTLGVGRAKVLTHSADRELAPEDRPVDRTWEVVRSMVDRLHLWTPPMFLGLHGP